MKTVISKIIAVGAMILALSFTAKAQGPGGPGGFPGGPGGQRPNPTEMAKRQADEMKQLVKLSDEQYAKVLALYKKQAEEMEKGMGNPQQGGFDFEAMQKRQQEQEAQIKKILTEDQYKKWSEEQSKRRGGFGGPGGPGGPGQGGPMGPPPGQRN